METCGDVTRYIFQYVWCNILGRAGAPTLAMYDDARNNIPDYYDKHRLQEEFPPIGGSEQNAIHFVFQGENDAWDDLTGTMHSHEYVLFQTDNGCWSCQAWACMYNTRWAHIDDAKEIRHVLNRDDEIDVAKLETYFHLDVEPEGFGSSRRDVSTDYYL